MQFRQAKFNECLVALWAAGTAPENVNCWGEQLSALFGLLKPAPQCLFASRTTAQVEVAVGLARKQQSMLFWEGFLQGRHSVYLGRAHALHVQLRKEERKRGLPWSQKSVQLVGEIVPSLWRKQNELVRGAMVAEEHVK